MICPFEPSEKQALLEAGDFDERCRVLTALADMALAQHARGGDAPLQ
jgi:Lon protease-like protein